MTRAPDRDRDRLRARVRELEAQLARERSRNAGLEHGVTALSERVAGLRRELDGRLELSRREQFLRAGGG